eukprot:gene25407-31024_t
MNYLGSVFGGTDANFVSEKDTAAKTANINSGVESDEDEGEDGNLEQMVMFFYEALKEAGQTNQDLNVKVDRFLTKDKARDEILKLKRKASVKLKETVPSEKVATGLVAPEAVKSSTQEDIEKKLKEMRERIKEESTTIKQMEKDLPAEVVELRQQMQNLSAITEVNTFHLTEAGNDPPEEGRLDAAEAGEPMPSTDALVLAPKGVNAEGALLPAHASSITELSLESEEDRGDLRLAAHARRVRQALGVRAALLARGEDGEGAAAGATSAAQSPSELGAAGESTAQAQGGAAEDPMAGKQVGSSSWQGIRSKLKKRFSVCEPAAAGEEQPKVSKPKQGDAAAECEAAEENDADREIAISFLSKFSTGSDDPLVAKAMRLLEEETTNESDAVRAQPTRMVQTSLTGKLKEVRGELDATRAEAAAQVMELQGSVQKAREELESVQCAGKVRETELETALQASERAAASTQAELESSRQQNVAAQEELAS